MAAPTDTARVATNIATAGTSHAINVGSPVVDTLLIVFVRFAAAPGTITFTGYTSIFNDSTDASDDTSAVYYRQADGTEGATDTLTTGNSVKLGAIAWEITGAADPIMYAPQVSAAAVGTGANPDPAAISGLPSDDYLILALAGLDGETQTFTAPTNYSNLVEANSGTGGAAASNCRLGGASRAMTEITTEDPGTFTAATPSTGWTAVTVAVREPFVLPPGPAITRRRPGHRFLTLR